MNRLLVSAIGGLMLIGAAGLVFAIAGQDRRPIFIAGDQPVTEDQIRQKLQSDGWSDVRVMREGRYFEVTGIKNGQASTLAADLQSGRLRADDDDDDDDDD